MTQNPRKLFSGFDWPACLALAVAWAGVMLSAYYRAVLSGPRIGTTATDHTAQFVQLSLFLLLALVLWRRNWLATPLRAMLAPFLGAVVALLMLSMPIMTVTRMDFNRSSGKVQMLNVVMMPGLASIGSQLVVANASVKAPPQATQTGSMLKGEGWLAVQLDHYHPAYWLWLVLIVAPLLGLLAQKWRPVKAAIRPNPPEA